jgi:molybdopterin molybdotransferase
MIRAALTASGGVPLNLGIASDNPDSVRSRLEQALELEADLILSSAGVSMGAHDYVRLVVEEGGELAFWRVNIRPGKPLAFGQYRQVPFIGLPGNPVSAWVTFNVFVRPALAALQAEAASGPRCISAELVQAVASDGRESYLRVRLERKGDRVLARLTGSQDSAVLSSLTQADGLLVLPAGVGMMEAGQPAEVWLLGEAGLVEGMKEFD